MKEDVEGVLFFFNHLVRGLFSGSEKKFFNDVNTNVYSPISGHSNTAKQARRSLAKIGEMSVDFSGDADKMITGQHEAEADKKWRWDKRKHHEIGRVEQKEKPGCTPGRFAWLVWHLTSLSLYTELITVMQRAQFYSNKARETEEKMGTNKTPGKQGTILPPEKEMLCNC